MNEAMANSLFSAIRNKQYDREVPLIISLLRKVASGEFQIDKNGVRFNDTHFPGGVCLNDEINFIVCKLR